MKSWQVAIGIVVIVVVIAYVSTQKPKTVSAPTSSNNNLFATLTSLGGAIAGKVGAPSAASGTPYGGLTADQRAAAYGQGYGLAQGQSDQQLSDSINQAQQEQDSFTNPFAGTLLG